MYILVTNFHSIKNKGDLGIVLGLINSLKEKSDNLHFGIVGKNIEERIWWEKNGVDFFVPLLSNPKNSGKLSAIKFCFNYYLSLFFISNSQSASSHYKDNLEKLKTLEAYKGADLIISKGGSFFREPGYKSNILPVGILGHLHQLMVAKKLSKPVILSAQSFGPINNVYSKWILKNAFGLFDLITTRDSDSELFLREKLGIKDNLYTVGDSAFLLGNSNGEDGDNLIFKTIENDKKIGKKCVGLTVRSWSNKKEYDNYIKALVYLLNIYTKKGFVFYLMPQVVGPSSVEDDRIVSKELFGRVDVEQRKHIRLVEEELDIADLLKLYKKMDYFIATRLHSAIFSILAEVPVVAIGYEPKTESVFKDLGILKFVSDIRYLSEDKMVDLFEQLLNTQRNIYLQIKRKAFLMAEKNIELILEK